MSVSVYGIKYGKRAVAWGTLFPGIMLIVTISMVPFIVRFEFD